MAADARRQEDALEGYWAGFKNRCGADEREREALTSAVTTSAAMRRSVRMHGVTRLRGAVRRSDDGWQCAWRCGEASRTAQRGEASRTRGDAGCPGRGVAWGDAKRGACLETHRAVPPVWSLSMSQVYENRGACLCASTCI